MDVAIIPCSDENGSSHLVRRYVDFTLPGDQIIFGDGSCNSEAIRLAGAMTMQAMQSAVQEMVIGKPNIRLARSVIA